MSDRDGTAPRRITGLPVRELELEVVSGPEAGLRASSVDEPITVGTFETNTVRLTDRAVSRFHLELSRRRDRIMVADLGSTNGTQIGPVSIEGGAVAIEVGAQIRIGATTLRVGDGTVRMEAQDEPPPLPGVSARSPAMLRILRQLSRLAHSEVPVLFLGESGTGKEVLARALHDCGPRAANPFVVVDCASLVGNLFESSLFGHERGAFTGAERQHRGALERVGSGTLFIDELGELSGSQQAALLGVLDRRRFQRVGGASELPLQARVVAATHRDLRAEVNRGQFRLDLYYRLAVITLRLPPLRDRLEDIPLLVQRFLVEAGHNGEPAEILGQPNLDGFFRHTWPGNVRELKNVVSATLALGEAPELGAPSGDADAVVSSLGMSYREAKALVTHDFEQRYLTDLMARAAGNVRGAARLARMNRAYLIELLSRHGLK